MSNFIDKTLEDQGSQYFESTNFYKSNENDDLKLAENDYETSRLDIKDEYIKTEMARQLFELGITYFSIGKYILAAKYFKGAMSFNPRLVNFFLGLSYHRKAKTIERSGNFYSARKNYHEAISYYSLALKEEGFLPSNNLLNELLESVYLEMGEKVDISYSIMNG